MRQRQIESESTQLTAAREQEWEWEARRGQPTLLPDKQQQQQQQTSLAAHCARHLRRIRIERERETMGERAFLRAQQVWRQRSAAAVVAAAAATACGRRVAFACRVGRAISFIYCMHKGDRVVEYPVTARACTSVGYFALYRYNANVPLSWTQLPCQVKEHSVGHQNSATCKFTNEIKNIFLNLCKSN